MYQHIAPREREETRETGKEKERRTHTYTHLVGNVLGDDGLVLVLL